MPVSFSPHIEAHTALPVRGPELPAECIPFSSNQKTGFSTTPEPMILISMILW